MWILLLKQSYSRVIDGNKHQKCMEQHIVRALWLLPQPGDNSAWCTHLQTCHSCLCLCCFSHLHFVVVPCSTAPEFTWERARLPQTMLFLGWKACCSSASLAEPGSNMGSPCRASEQPQVSGSILGVCWSAAAGLWLLLWFQESWKHVLEGENISEFSCLGATWKNNLFICCHESLCGAQSLFCPWVP